MPCVDHFRLHQIILEENSIFVGYRLKPSRQFNLRLSLSKFYEKMNNEHERSPLDYTLFWGEIFTDDQDRGDAFVYWGSSTGV